MTGHGFRGVASTILHETRAIHGFEHEHIELQRAHGKPNEVSAAYDYSKYIPERTKMMQWWADHLDEMRRKREGPAVQGNSRLTCRNWPLARRSDKPSRKAVTATPSSASPTTPTSKT